MKLFVTGGAGFIGSNFLHLLPDNYTAVNFDALTYAGNPDNLKGLARRHRFIVGDITDIPAVKRAIKGCDAVVHFAAESHVDRSIKSAYEFLHTNVIGTQVLLDVARESYIKRFLYVSTDEVMGSLREGTYFTESSPFAPNSPYAASKAAAEHLVRAAHKTFGLEVVITRCGNNYGPRQHIEKFIPMVITRALANKRIPLYGTGFNVRDWIYVDDHCRALLKVLEQGETGTVYNIGARQCRRNHDVLTYILEVLDKPWDLIELVEDRKGHDWRYAIDPTRIESLGWAAQESWETGIRKTIAWYEDNHCSLQRKAAKRQA